MSGAAPSWVEAAVAVLVLASALLCLLAAVGLVRLGDFFQRLHAPALASTVAVWCMALASAIYHSVLSGEPALQVWVLSIVMAITAPVTTMLLARAALFRRRARGDPAPPPLGDSAAAPRD